MPDEPPRFSHAAEDLIAALRRLPNEDPGRMRKRATKDLASLVDTEMVKYQIGRQSPEQTVRDHWAEIVGSANAHYSHPARIERNALVVLASHAVVRNELFHHRKTIVEKIQKLSGCADIRMITVRAG
jgi:hypothetical protein